MLGLALLSANMILRPLLGIRRIDGALQVLADRCHLQEFLLHRRLHIAFFGASQFENFVRLDALVTTLLVQQSGLAFRRCLVGLSSLKMRPPCRAFAFVKRKLRFRMRSFFPFEIRSPAYGVGAA